MSTVKSTYEIDTNDLGELIEKYRSDNGRISKDIYFRPYQGAYISGITREGKGDARHEPVTSALSPTINQNDPDLIYCEFIGTEYEYDIGNAESIHYIYNVEINGFPNKVSLEIIGEENIPDKNIAESANHHDYIFFQYSDPNGRYMTQTIVYRQNDLGDKYTNVVCFNASEFVLDSPIEPHSLGSKLCKNFNWEGYAMVIDDSWEYTNDVLALHISHRSDITLVQLYVNCRIGVFTLTDKPCKTNSSEDSLCDYEFQVRTIYKGLSEKLRNNEAAENELDVQDNLDIFNGSIFINENGEKKYLWPDIAIYNNLYSEMLVDKDESGLDKMVGENSNTIPNDLLWIENCYDGLGRKISRYTHVVRLINDNTNTKISDILSAESEYARFTGFWCVMGKYYNVRDRFPRYTYIHQNSKIPSEGGNMVFLPVFKPYAECDLLMFYENDIIPMSYGAFFTSKLDDIYNDKQSGNSFKKSRYVNVNAKNGGTRAEVNGKLVDFLNTVSPYKNLIVATHGGRDVYIEGVENSGRSWFSIVRKKFKPSHIQNLIKYSKYWWSDSKWEHKLCFGLFSCACFSSGIQDETTRPIFGNCVAHDSKKIVPELDDMFYELGSTATHTNHGNPTFSLELPFMIRTAKITSTYSEFCHKFNKLVEDFKSAVFDELRNFYDNFYEDMIACLRLEEDKDMWRQTHNVISQDLINLGKQYFCIPYYDPETESSYRDGTDTRIHLNNGNTQYYIHDGVIGLIRKLVFETDEKNMKSYFSSDDFEKWFNVLENISNLGTEIEKIKNQVIGSDYPTWSNLIAITEPVCGCSGVYKTSNAPFMANPNQDYDEWLTSDSDLEKLETLTSGFIIVAPDET